MKILFAAFIFCIFFSCSRHNRLQMPAGQEINATEYLRSKQVDSESASCKMEFWLVSNPFEWSKDDIMLLYVNHKVAYIGSFELGGVISLGKLKNSDLVHCKLEIIRGGKLYRFENKSTFNWHDEYKYMYIGLFPYNPETDNVHFFPQRQQAI